MRRAKPQPIRNKIDLADPAQIRAWTRRLGITADDLRHVAGKVGKFDRRRQQGDRVAESTRA
jgi:Protein of unknown function (DUF3606)